MLVEFMFKGIMCCKRPPGQFRANKKKGGWCPTMPSTVATILQCVPTIKR